jgi:hypothetical protein
MGDGLCVLWRIGMQTPALNMHMAFVTIICVYFISQSFKNNQKAILFALESLLL